MNKTSVEAQLSLRVGKVSIATCGTQPLYLDTIDLVGSKGGETNAMLAADTRMDVQRDSKYERAFITIRVVSQLIMKHSCQVLEYATPFRLFSSKIILNQITGRGWLNLQRFQSLQSGRVCRVGHPMQETIPPSTYIYVVIIHFKRNQM